MTVSEFDLLVKFIGGFSVGLISMSFIMLRYIRMDPDVEDFVKAFGLGVGLCLFGVFLMLWILQNH